MEKDGKFKIKNAVLLITLALTIVNCNNKQINGQQIIEENFLEIVDTTAYEVHSFRPVPPIVSNELSDKPMRITLFDSVSYNGLLENDANNLKISSESLKKSYKDVFQKGKYLDFILNDKFPKKIGKYFINNIDTNNFIYLGEIEFYNFRIYRDKAILTIVKSEGHHKIAHLIFLQQVNNSWRFVKKELLFVS